MTMQCKRQPFTSADDTQEKIEAVWEWCGRTTKVGGDSWIRARGTAVPGVTQTRQSHLRHS